MNVDRNRLRTSCSGVYSQVATVVVGEIGVDSGSKLTSLVQGEQEVYTLAAGVARAAVCGSCLDRLTRSRRSLGFSDKKAASIDS